MGCFSCCSAYRIILVVNCLIAFFGLIAIIGGSVSVANYDTKDEFFSKTAYVLIIVAGLMTFFVAALAITGGRDPKLRPNYLFCYWCIMSVILLVNFIAFYYFRTFFLSIQRTTETTTGKLLSIVETQFAKEFQDYILSTYVACCTGCDSSIPELQCSSGGFASELTLANCPSVKLASSVDVADCIYAEPCSFDQLSDGNHGLGSGCFTVEDQVPGFGVGVDTCQFLTQLTLDDQPLVGPVSNGKSCGKGNPTKYVSNFFDYFEGKYYLFAVPWGFSIVLEVLAWLAAVYLIMCPYDPTTKN